MLRKLMSQQDMFLLATKIQLANRDCRSGQGDALQLSTQLTSSGSILSCQYKFTEFQFRYWAPLFKSEGPAQVAVIVLTFLLNILGPMVPYEEWNQLGWQLLN